MKEVSRPFVGTVDPAKEIISLFVYIISSVEAPVHAFP